jgi:hypothetical protein
MPNEKGKMKNAKATRHKGKKNFLLLPFAFFILP